MLYMVSTSMKVVSKLYPFLIMSLYCKCHKHNRDIIDEFSIILIESFNDNKNIMWLIIGIVAHRKNRRGNCGINEKC